MDNLAHTLVGAAIGRAVAARRVPAAGWIGAVAANAPDWSEFLIGNQLRGSVTYYAVHRGITHSLVGAAIEIVAIFAALWMLFRVVRRVPERGVPMATLFGLVSAAVTSHVYMDYQGSYGLRPFLPWSGRWYYGDWVAIVDPLFWLVPLVALAWGAERHWRDLVPVVLLAALIAWLVVRVDGVAGWLRVACTTTLGIGAVGWVRHWYGVAARRRVSTLALLVLAVYALAQAVASVPANAAARHTAVARFGPRAGWAALTHTGTPFEWEAIAASHDTVAGRRWALPRHLDDPQVQFALRDTPAGRAFREFARFLVAQVDSGPDGEVVTLRDARYARPPATGWGVVTVRLPPNGPQ